MPPSTPHPSSPYPTSPTSPCPFCGIASANTPPPPSLSSISPPSSTPPPSTTPRPPSNPPPSKSHLLLSTRHVLAFLDHAPISRGHVLLATRAHREKLSDVTVEEGRALGAWLGVVSRAVVGAVAEGEAEEEGDGFEGAGGGDWNVVQNNGARAAQVVPHVHFHIIPRNGDVPEVKARSWTVFGKGQREDLDDEDAAVLVGRMRKGLEREVERVRRREGEGVVRALFGERGEEEGGKGGGWKL